MKNEIDAICDDLLARWHRWRSGYTHTSGYAGTSATFRDTPPTWSAYGRDDDADASVEETMMCGVEKAVDTLPNTPAQPMRLCIQFEARNLASGAAVWTSPRLPKGEELEILKIQSRTALLKVLHSDGLVGG